MSDRTLDEKIREIAARHFPNGEAGSYRMACESAIREALALRDAGEAKPVAYLVPHIITFKGATRTSCPPEHQDAIEGTVAWSAEIFSDGDGVTDKRGVTHKPIPLVVANDPDANRWRRFAASPQTALMLGSKLDPNSEQDWVAECNRLVDALT